MANVVDVAVNEVMSGHNIFVGTGIKTVEM